MGLGLLERADMKKEQTSYNPLPPSLDSWQHVTPSPHSWNPLAPSPDSFNQVPHAPSKDLPFKESSEVPTSEESSKVPTSKRSSKDSTFKPSSKDPTSKSKKPSMFRIIKMSFSFVGMIFIPWILANMARIPPEKCNGVDTK